MGATGTYVVAEGAGQVVVGPGQTREARLDVGAANIEVTGTLRHDRLPVGGNTFAYVLARATATDAYRGAIRLAPDGRVFVQLKRVVNRVESNVAGEVNSGLVTSAGQPIRFRFRTVGDTLRLRVWQGATQPDTWQTVAADTTVSGATRAGVMGYVGKPVTNGAATLSLDEFEVGRG